MRLMFYGTGNKKAGLVNKTARRYENIIDIKFNDIPRKRRMTMLERAAQFAPFDALKTD